MQLPRKGVVLTQAERNRLRAKKRSFHGGVRAALRLPPGLAPCWQEIKEDYGELTVDQEDHGELTAEVLQCNDETGPTPELVLHKSVLPLGAILPAQRKDWVMPMSEFLQYVATMVRDIKEEEFARLAIHKGTLWAAEETVHTKPGTKSAAPLLQLEKEHRSTVDREREEYAQGRVKKQYNQIVEFIGRATLDRDCPGDVKRLMVQIIEQGGEWPEEEIAERLEQEFERQMRRTRLLRLEAHRDEYNKRLLMQGDRSRWSNVASPELASASVTGRLGTGRKCASTQPAVLTVQATEPWARRGKAPAASTT